MTKTPEANTIALVCNIEGAEFAPEFAGATCSALIELLSNFAPNQHVVERSSDTANVVCVLGLNMTIASAHHAKASLSSANPENWEANIRTTGDEMGFSIVDSTLRAPMASRFVSNLFNNFDKTALTNC